jgi:uncharacterized protein (DUF2225 family)
MDDRLYSKTIQCPACLKNIKVIKVKQKACKIKSKDTDFCVYYENFNPILCEPWVCENCGYSALSDKFEALPIKDAKLIREFITSKWNKRSFSEERTIETAIDALKLVLLNLNVRNAKSSDFAKVCMRIAWLYRFKNDTKEKEFIQFALDKYMQAYETERFPIDKLDEFTCIYMIAELNRRLSNYDESLKWFSKLISSPNARENKKLLILASDQIQLVRAAISNEEGNL